MNYIKKTLQIFIAVLMTILTEITIFLFSWCRHVLKYIFGICAIASVAFSINGKIEIGVAFLILAYLISPIGIPMNAMRLILKLMKKTALLRESAGLIIKINNE